MRALHLVSVLVLAAAATAGCNSFHYYDITVAFNNDMATGGFNQAMSEVSKVQVCLMSVSGADSASKRFNYTNGCPPPIGGSVGVFEFSTFADSGQLVFKLEAYDGQTTTPECKVGEGTTTISATDASLTTGMLSVNRASNATFCCSGNTC